MKKLQYLAFLFMALSALTFSSCGSDDDDNDTSPSNKALLTGGTWTGKSILLDDVDYTDTLALVGLDVSDWNFKFNDNGTVTTTLWDSTGTGNWEFANNEQAIVFEKGTADETTATIKKLTASELNLEFTGDELLGDDPNDSTLIEKVEIRYTR
ncbi:hypothetical protein [Pontibacter chitinilyticus]|uniref:hypothetical protein n=1 Tax=Pontibacter chitinilyticus TaxID=2674989 RepID=UPI00321C0E02